MCVVCAYHQLTNIRKQTYHFQPKGKINSNYYPNTNKPIGKILEGPITHVRDGDTFEVNDNLCVSLLWIAPRTAPVRAKSYTLCEKFKGQTAVCESLEPKLTTELGIAQSAGEPGKTRWTKHPVNSGPSMMSGIGTRETDDKEKTPALRWDSRGLQTGRYKKLHL